MSPDVFTTVEEYFELNWDTICILKGQQQIVRFLVVFSMNCLTLLNDCNQRILTILYILYPDFLQGCGFQSSFSSGDFVDVQQGRPTTSTTMQDEGRDSEEEPSDEWASDDLSGGLFSCPNEGCVKVYHRYSSLDKHLSFGKCKPVLERDTLLDKAKKLYHQKRLERTTSQATIEGDIISQDCARSPPEGWALKSTKKSYSLQWCPETFS